MENHENREVRFAEFILKNYLKEYDFFFDVEGKPLSPDEVWGLFQEQEKMDKDPLYAPFRRFNEKMDRELEDNPYKGYSEAVRKDVMNDSPCEPPKSEPYKLCKEAAEILTEEESCELNIGRSQDEYPNPLYHPTTQHNSILQLALEEQKEMTERLKAMEKKEKEIGDKLNLIIKTLNIDEE